jgi:hypothetical protein
MARVKQLRHLVEGGQLPDAPHGIHGGRTDDQHHRAPIRQAPAFQLIRPGMADVGQLHLQWGLWRQRQHCALCMAKR